MNLAQLVQLFRARTGDDTPKYRFAKALVEGFFDEAQNEACRRMDLIPESADEDLCELAVAVGTTSITLSPLWTRLTYAAFLPDASDDDSDPDRIPLEMVVDKQVIDRRRGSQWRSTDGTPSMLLIENRKVRFDCLPDTAGTLILEGFRLPTATLEDTADGRTPVIDAVHHAQLVDWAMYRCFDIPDSETIDKNRAKESLEAFERYFGARKDGRLWQDREVGAFNVAWP